MSDEIIHIEGERFCLECNKPNIYCKGRCQACYVRMYRKTETGKQAMKQYNLTKGKWAQKKYRKKIYGEKIYGEKPPKVNCECGKPSVAKNLCRTCYYKAYVPKIHISDAEIIFKKVLMEVKNGLSIQDACKLVGVDTSIFYKIITPIQKTELKAYKKIGFILNEEES